jgi:diadenosine tetraphosphate (Ap4A) HIT family hydrolase
MPAPKCPFCALPEGRVIDSDDHCVVIRDCYPVSEDHTLVIPRRHAGSFFDLSEVEQTSMLRLLRRAQEQITNATRANGSSAAPDFNIGINDGPAAGQTVPHVHMHLIPRRPGDVPDPRGGVRWVIPDRARYWPEET